MKKGIDCEVFQSQLDALSGGVLSEDGVQLVRRHAASCAECAMLLQLHEHLFEPSVKDLEAAVPDALAGSVWPRVKAEIAVRDSQRHPISGRWAGPGWLVPTLAAASALLLIGTGLLLGQMRKLHAREQALVQQVAEHEQRLAELDLRAFSGSAAARVGLGRRAGWERALARRESVSLSELREMVSGFPGGLTVISASEAEALEQGRPFHH